MVRDRERVRVSLNSDEQRLAVKSLLGFRNDLLVEGLPAEDVEDLILKVIDAPPEREKRRLFERDGR